MKERWKAVVGFEGAYEVSDQGRVRSLDRIVVCQQRTGINRRLVTMHRRLKGRVLRGAKLKSGHIHVGFGHNTADLLVHRLVLEAFIGPCPVGHEACHRDDVPSNNKLKNLYWGTRKENMDDAYRNGKHHVGEQHCNAKLNVALVRTMRELAKAMPIRQVAIKFGTPYFTAFKAIRGITWRSVI